MFAAIAFGLAVQQAEISKPGPSVQLKPSEIIQKMKIAVREASPFRVTSHIEARGFSLNISEINAMRPSFFSMTTTTKAPTGDVVCAEYHWTGAKQFTYHPSSNRYLDHENEMGPVEYQVIGLESAFSERDIYKDVKSTRLETFNHQPVFALEVTGEVDFTLYVNRETFLPVGYAKPVKDAYNFDTYVGDILCTVTYKEFMKKTPLKAENFAWSPPKDAKRFGEPTDRVA